MTRRLEVIFMKKLFCIGLIGTMLLSAAPAETHLRRRALRPSRRKQNRQRPASQKQIWQRAKG